MHNQNHQTSGSQTKGKKTVRGFISPAFPTMLVPTLSLSPCIYMFHTCLMHTIRHRTRFVHVHSYNGKYTDHNRNNNTDLEKERTRLEDSKEDAPAAHYRCLDYEPGWLPFPLYRTRWRLQVVLPPSVFTLSLQFVENKTDFIVKTHQKYKF